jgi:hypothetical protein
VRLAKEPGEQLNSTAIASTRRVKETSEHSLTEDSECRAFTKRQVLVDPTDHFFRLGKIPGGNSIKSLRVRVVLNEVSTSSTFFCPANLFTQWSS